MDRNLKVKLVSLSLPFVVILPRPTVASAMSWPKHVFTAFCIFLVFSQSNAHFQQGNSGSVRLGQVQILVSESDRTHSFRLSHSGAVMATLFVVAVTSPAVEVPMQTQPFPPLYLST